MARQLPIFMEEVPEYQIRADHMHIIWRELEIVLPVSTMVAGMAAAQEVLAKWQVARLGKGRVVKMPRKRK